MRGDQKRVYRSVCDDGDSLGRLGLEHRFYGLNKTPLRLVRAFSSYDTFVGFVKKRFERRLEVIKVLKVWKPVAVVFVQSGNAVTRYTEHFSGDAPRLSGFGFVTRDDYAWTMRAEPLSQKKTLRSPLFTQKPVFSGHIRLYLGKRMFDE